MLTWEDIGCGYGDYLTVIEKDGTSITGALVDFEMDYEDGSLGGDSITVQPKGSTFSWSINEHDIASIQPLPKEP